MAKPVEYTQLPKQLAKSLCGNDFPPAKLSDADYKTLCEACEVQLLDRLGRDKPVEATDVKYICWQQLLANWIKAIWQTAGEGVTHYASISLKGFSQSGRTAADIRTFKTQFGSLIVLFDQTKPRVSFQTDYASAVYAPDEDRLDYMFPDAPPILGGAL